MDEEGFLDSSHPAGDPVGGGSHRRSRSGGDWVDNEGAMGRGHVRPNMGLDLGSGFGAADAQAGQGSSRKRVGIDARRSDTVNLDDEDDGLIRNGSATREAPFKGLKTNDIHHVWNHGPKHGGGFHCRYCNMKNSGGGATRFKEHLGKIVGEVKECPNVPRNVHDIMRKAVLEMRKKKREKESRKLRFERMYLVQLRGGVVVAVVFAFPLGNRVSQPTLTSNCRATKYQCNPRSALLWIAAQGMLLAKLGRSFSMQMTSLVEKLTVHIAGRKADEAKKLPSILQASQKCFCTLQPEVTC